MFYKKNESQKLDENLFKNPTAEYRGTPFWAWNCELTKDILKEQIEYLKEMGFGGFHMHARSGLSTEYLGEEFMELIKTCVDKAEEEHMLAYLYDEDRWPSGSAGGLVTKTPLYRQRYLMLTPHKRNDVVSKEEGVLQGKTYALAVYDVVLNEMGELKEYRVIGENDALKGDKWYAYVCTADKTGWHNNQTYVDTLSKIAMDKFIEITYEAYKEKVGDKFGGVVPSIFTDEPQFTRKTVLDYALEKKTIILPWTPDFDETYFSAYNIDLIKALPELLWELESKKPSQVRYFYHDHICERFVQAFADNCGKWCDENNLILTGHMMEEPTLHSQTAALGETMRSYRSFKIPGIDMLCDNIELSTAKQAQSAVHQYGYEAMMSELYGVTGWEFDFRGHKFQGDWQAALGVTIRVPHLSWVSMKGSAKRDYPASINYQSPWYKEYTFVEDHFARLNTALTRGKPLVNVGVIHPVESYWLHWGPSQNTADIRNQLEDNFRNVIEWLLFGLVDFDFISESLLLNQCKNIDKTLNVGEMNYSAIVVPGCETIRRTTFEILKKYKAKGGKIIFVGDCPKYIDAIESDEIKELFDESIKAQFNKISLLNTLNEEKIIEIRDNLGKSKDNLIYSMRCDGDFKWLFIAHGKKTPLKDIVPPENIVIKIKGSYKPTLYDTINGETKEIEYHINNGYTEINRTIYAWDSLLLKLDETDTQCFEVPQKKENISKSIDIKGKVKYKREEDNVMVLDMAKYKINDGEFEPTEEILRIDGKLRKVYNFPLADGHDAQPWTIEKEVITNFVTLLFEFESEIELSDVLFATENAERITVNNENISLKATGYYVDKSILTYKVPKIRKGKNIIEIVMPFGKRVSLENCFLLGDFNVITDGCISRIVSSSKDIAFGSVVNQGMPFYGGEITYETELETNECSLSIRASYYRGAVIKVYLDDVEAGYIAYAPYKLRIDNVKKGRHTLKFRLYGNRANTFGALHHLYDHWKGPGMWYTKDDNWSYEYRLLDMGIMASPVIEVIE